MRSFFNLPINSRIYSSNPTVLHIIYIWYNHYVHKAITKLFLFHIAVELYLLDNIQYHYPHGDDLSCHSYTENPVSKLISISITRFFVMSQELTTLMITEILVIEIEIVKAKFHTVKTTKTTKLKRLRNSQFRTKRLFRSGIWYNNIMVIDWH